MTMTSMSTPTDGLGRRCFGLLQRMFAVLGLGIALAIVLLAARPEMRGIAEARLMQWLELRQGLEPVTLAAGADAVLQHAASPVIAVAVAIDAEAEAQAAREQKRAEAALATARLAELAAATASAEAAARTLAAAAERADEPALAANPRDLPRAQASVAYWLSKKYKVAAEPLSVLVAEAWETGRRTRLDPTLILAIMAIESSFNPFAQSNVGAQGLMQVMTRIHTDKYDSAGGTLAAFNPVANLRVGVEVLLECIERAGSLRGGLKYYVGAANLPTDNGYSDKVLAEHARIKQVAGGRAVSLDAQPTGVRAGPSGKAGIKVALAG